MLTNPLLSFSPHMHLPVLSFSWLSHYLFVYFSLSISFCISFLIWWMAHRTHRGENASDVVSLCSPLSKKPPKYHPCIMQILHIVSYLMHYPFPVFSSVNVFTGCWMHSSVYIYVSLPKSISILFCCSIAELSFKINFEIQCHWFKKVIWKKWTSIYLELPCIWQKSSNMK